MSSPLVTSPVPPDYKATPRYPASVVPIRPFSPLSAEEINAFAFGIAVQYAFDAAAISALTVWDIGGRRLSTHEAQLVRDRAGRYCRERPRIQECGPSRLDFATLPACPDAMADAPSFFETLTPHHRPKLLRKVHPFQSRAKAFAFAVVVGAAQAEVLLRNRFEPMPKPGRTFALVCFTVAVVLAACVVLGQPLPWAN